MEKFSKVLSKQQKMMEYMQWRNKLAERLVKHFDIIAAASIMGRCRISFDVQPEAHEVEMIMKNFTKSAGMPIFVRISLS